MERRKHHRQPLTLSAMITTKADNFLLCTIRDYCSGGMFLAVTEEDSQGLIRGSHISIHFSLNTSAGKKDLQMEAHVASCFSGGMGVSFIEPDKVILQLLSDLSMVDKRATQTENLTPESFKKIINDFLSSMTLVFFKEVADALFKVANYARSNSEQTYHFEAMSELKKLHDPIEKYFCEAIINDIENKNSQGNESQSLADLSLLEKDEFEDLLVISEIISTAENKYEAQLIDLQYRLPKIFKHQYSKENLPIGPATLTRSFRDAISSMHTHITVKNLIYKVFADNVIYKLDDFYDQLIALLDQQNIAKLPQRKKPVKSEATEVKAETKQANDNKISNQKQSQPQPHSARRNQPNVSQQFVIDSIMQMQPQYIQQKMADEARVILAEITQNTPINSQQKQDIVNAKQIFNAISNHPYINVAIKQWCDMLLKPVLKQVMNAGAVFSKPSEPIYTLIDNLNKLGNIASDHEQVTHAGIKKKVDGLLSSGLQSSSSVDFNVLSTEIQKVLQKQQQQIQRNKNRVVQNFDGQQKLLRSKRLIEQSLLQLFTNQQIPTIVQVILDGGWRDLLVLTQLKEKAKEDFHAYLKTLKKIIITLKRIPAKATHISVLNNEVLLGLSAAGVDKIKQHALCDTLEALLKGEQEIRYQQYIDNKMSSKPCSSNHYYAKKAINLKPGENLTLKINNVDKSVHLAKISEDKQSFLFINEQGLKVAELSLDDVVNALHQQYYLPDKEAPIMDCAALGVYQDIHQQLAYNNTHDTLTQLYNRKACAQFLTQLGANLGDNEHTIAFLDLDQFKVINNTCGHEVGDQSLIKIVELIQRFLPKNSIFSRMGGDEFCIILKDTALETGYQLIDKIRNAVAHFRFIHDKKPFTFTVSTGLVAMNKAMYHTSAIMQAADSSLFAAKDNGRNRIQIYQQNNAQLIKHHESITWVSKINLALDNQRFKLRCQKITPIENNQLIPHYEVLLSILDAEDKALPPADFIEAAEQYQKMTAIDKWVVENTIVWLDQNLEALNILGGVAINLSGQSLNEPDFLEFVMTLLKESKVPLQKVCFEVTETVAIGNIDYALNFIKEIKILGCEFSLDDFGTGLSSYAYLQDMPVDYLKIDGAFIKNILHNPNDQAMVRSINEIAHAMGKRTIAEYVENMDIYRYLHSLGVDYAQGYGIEKPKFLFDMLS